MDEGDALAYRGSTMKRPAPSPAWFLVPAVVVLAWCSTREPLRDGATTDTVDEGQALELRCTRACEHFAAATCPQPDCVATCRRLRMMAGDTCGPLYDAYLDCAATANVMCTHGEGDSMSLPDCATVHGAAATCMGGPSDGGL
jgi:hypothetical protein